MVINEYPFAPGGSLSAAKGHPHKRRVTVALETMAFGELAYRIISIILDILVVVPGLKRWAGEKRGTIQVRPLGEGRRFTAFIIAAGRSRRWLASLGKGKELENSPYYWPTIVQKLKPRGFTPVEEIP